MKKKEKEENLSNRRLTSEVLTGITAVSRAKISFFHSDPLCLVNLRNGDFKMTVFESERLVLPYTSLSNSHYVTLVNK